MYDRLFSVENVADVIKEDEDLGVYLNKDSIKIYGAAKFEESLHSAPAGERFQFVRSGYFIRDSRNTNVFNNIVNLKDTWAKIAK